MSQVITQNGESTVQNGTVRFDCLGKVMTQKEIDSEDYEQYISSILKSELEVMNKYSPCVIVEVDTYFSWFNSHKDSDDKIAPFVTIDVTLEPIMTKNIGGKKIKAISLDEDFFKVVSLMKDLGFYPDMNIVQIRKDSQHNKNPFETQLTFYSEHWRN